MITTTRLSELTGDYVLDTAHTRIGFIARHTMATKVPGQFGEFEGSAHLDGDDPSKSSAQLTIHAKSIQTRNQQRDEARWVRYARKHLTYLFHYIPKPVGVQARLLDLLKIDISRPRWLTPQNPMCEEQA